VLLPQRGGGNFTADYEASITLRGKVCHRHPHGRNGCVLLRGTLTGSGEDEETHIPDGGGSVRFNVASDHLRMLGSATATCRIHGVGYIRKGRRGLIMLISTQRGGIGISAAGPMVPGFSGL
jgi:hypothetical protein